MHCAARWRALRWTADSCSARCGPAAYSPASWRELGYDGPNASGDLHFARTHPTSPVRFLQMQKVAEEIAEKQRNHLPLVPDLKTAAGP
jgi:hypothetical protein